MDVSPAVYALLGTVAGGGITVYGQSLIDRRKAKSDADAHRRQVLREHAAEQRQAVYALLDRIGADVSSIRSVIVDGQDDVNLKYVEALERASRLVSAARDGSLGLVAKIADVNVREAANAVYRLWGEFAHLQSDDLVNGREGDLTGVANAALRADEALTSAARTYLNVLDEQALGS